MQTGVHQKDEAANEKLREEPSIGNGLVTMACRRDGRWPLEMREMVMWRLEQIFEAADL